ncbi:class I SAM-dependent methyltransferase [Mesoterricola silvestris]|uniref:S-adenosyl-L-methionine-dependent methyltransferase n=1 Tax=Mesoterricola silvestris TaxID=2927979 RepID=A0AA48GYU0_9BACT|nr:SAM-dependent methyltransferase [Mesoterricola silvestris]BDU72868.1 S-adenosyl-L-methionine-dependent methyltransferase [Mesoterricola silvestris]
MQPGEPSRTALGAATHRAVHQVLEQGRIFTDPLAGRILGPEAALAARRAEGDATQRQLRLFIAVRTRFAEDALRTAFARGARQLVVLGAGLDTYAYRNPLGQDLDIYEVDHPDTQQWKRRLLAEAAIPVPDNLTYVPVDFECETLEDGLTLEGFDPGKRTFFTWLGVVPYLAEETVFSTLAFIASLPGGAQVVFDYGNPPGATPSAVMDTLERRVASVGEHLRSRFETEDLHARLRDLGFRAIEDLGPAGIRNRFFAGRGGAPLERGGHILLATSG